MIRMTLLCLGLTTAMLATGCCGPMGCGPGMGVSACDDCAGCGVGGEYISNSPMEGLQRWRKGLTCGYGCGETYVDEWISTPPNCSDPCCGDQFVGGAVAAQPLTWQPGMLFGGLYGKRYCSGDASSAPCACGVVECGGCGGGEVIVDSGYIDSGVIDGGHIQDVPTAVPAPAAGGSSGCGCASCATPSGTRLAHRPTANSITARAQRTMDSRSTRIR